MEACRIIDRVSERQRRYHAHAWDCHQATGDFVGFGQTPNLIIEIALLIAHLLVDQQQRRNNYTEWVIFSQQLDHLLSERKAGGSSEQEPVFLDHAANLVLDIPPNADKARPCIVLSGTCPASTRSLLVEHIGQPNFARIFRDADFRHAVRAVPRKGRSITIRSWRIIRGTVYGFIEDEALSRGAAIAFYTATSIAPVMLIVIAIAGMVFGQDAAQNAITGQLSGLMGDQTAQLLQSAVASASKKSSGTLATLVGLVTLILTASGVFGEMQAALNAIWKAEPSGAAITRLIRARAVSLGLVAALGFLLLVSLVVSATCPTARSPGEMSSWAP
jgi:Virulence factor BrkB